MQKLIVALTLLFGGIAANDRDGHSRLLRGRGKTVDHPEAGSKAALSRQDAGDEPVRAAARRLATVEEGIPPECVLAFEAVTKDGTKLKDFPACIDNLVVVAEAVLNKPESFADAGPDARDSILIQMIAKNRKSDTVIPFDDEETVTFKSSDVFALPAVAKNGMDLQKYPESKENLIVVMQAVLKTPNAFEFAGCHAQSDLLIQLVATGLQPENLDLVQKGCGEPTPEPTAEPTTAEPTAKPTTAEPTAEPTAGPTAAPTPAPTQWSPAQCTTYTEIDDSTRNYADSCAGVTCYRKCDGSLVEGWHRFTAAGNTKIPDVSDTRPNRYGAQAGFPVWLDYPDPTTVHETTTGTACASHWDGSGGDGKDYCFREYDGIQTTLCESAGVKYYVYYLKPLTESCSSPDATTGFLYGFRWSTTGSD